MFNKTLFNSLNVFNGGLIGRFRPKTLSLILFNASNAEFAVLKKSKMFNKTLFNSLNVFNGVLIGRLK